MVQDAPVPVMGCCATKSTSSDGTGDSTDEASPTSSEKKKKLNFFTKKKKVDVGAMVYLHIYDVRNNALVSYMNNLLYIVGTGAFHVGVEVYGDEWSYGYMEEESRPGCTGVFSCKPGENKLMGAHREAVSMGSTNFNRDQVDEILRTLSAAWPAEEYQILSHNCCCFSDEFCRQLGVGAIPDWVRNLASAGASVAGGAHAIFHPSTNFNAIVAKAKGHMPTHSSGSLEGDGGHPREEKAPEDHETAPKKEAPGDETSPQDAAEVCRQKTKNNRNDLLVKEDALRIATGRELKDAPASSENKASCSCCRFVSQKSSS